MNYKSKMRWMYCKPFIVGQILSEQGKKTTKVP